MKDIQLKYMITKTQCQKQIDKLDNVCDRCGRKLVPIKTVDSAHNLTYRFGCYHGGKFGHFTCGVKKHIFDLAKKLVCQGETLYPSLSKSKCFNKKDRLYWFQNQTSRFCNLLRVAEYLKDNKPKKTKREFLEAKYFYGVTK